MYVVTGITRMKTGICVSVYDVHNRRYLRPIPPSRRFQTQDVAALRLFSIVDLKKDNRWIEIKAPHVEDFPIKNNTLSSIRRLDVIEQIKFLRQISVPSVHDVFGYDEQGAPFLKRGVNQRNYVLPGSGSCSLGTIKANVVKVYNDPYDNNKLRVDFTDSLGNDFFNVPYVSIFQTDPERLTQSLQDCNEIYVRLSLSRSLKPNTWDFYACFLQVSSIHGYKSKV